MGVLPMIEDECPKCGHKVIVYWSDRDKRTIGRCTFCEMYYDLKFVPLKEVIG